jgi:hypothetical protein
MALIVYLCAIYRKVVCAAAARVQVCTTHCLTSATFISAQPQFGRPLTFHLHQRSQNNCPSGTGTRQGFASLSVRNNFRIVQWRFMKFAVAEFYWSVSNNSNFNKKKPDKITDPFHEQLLSFLGHLAKNSLNSSWGETFFRNKCCSDKLNKPCTFDLPHTLPLRRDNYMNGSERIRPAKHRVHLTLLYPVHI